MARKMMKRKDLEELADKNEWAAKMNKAKEDIEIEKKWHLLFFYKGKNEKKDDRDKKDE